jgi:hypothetical protein
MKEWAESRKEAKTKVKTIYETITRFLNGNGGGCGIKHFITPMPKTAAGYRDMK